MSNVRYISQPDRGFSYTSYVLAKSKRDKKDDSFSEGPAPIPTNPILSNGFFYRGSKGSIAGIDKHLLQYNQTEDSFSSSLIWTLTLPETPGSSGNRFVVPVTLNNELFAIVYSNIGFDIHRIDSENSFVIDSFFSSDFIRTEALQLAGFTSDNKLYHNIDDVLIRHNNKSNFSDITTFSSPSSASIGEKWAVNQNKQVFVSDNFTYRIYSNSGNLENSAVYSDISPVNQMRAAIFDNDFIYTADSGASGTLNIFKFSHTGDTVATTTLSGAENPSYMSVQANRLLILTRPGSSVNLSSFSKSSLSLMEDFPIAGSLGNSPFVSGATIFNFGSLPILPFVTTHELIDRTQVAEIIRQASLLSLLSGDLGTPFSVASHPRNFWNIQ